MKKITFFALAAALMLPMTLSAKVATTVKAFKANETKNVTIAKRDAATPQAIKIEGKTHMLGMPKAEGETLVWDFEDADQFAQFLLEDRDGDGYNWQYYSNVGVETGQMTTHSGDGIISSASYINNGSGGGTPVTPDNWLISPAVTLGGSLSFWAMGQDASYAAEVFGVYVSVDGENWTQVGVDKTATGEYVLYEYDLSAFDGQEGQFAIVHHNVTDMFMLNVDDITFNPSGYVSPEPFMPTELTAAPTATTADIAWVPGDNNARWDLRWRPYIDPSLIGANWSMDNSNYQAIAGLFSIIDADGDGYNWGLSYADDTQTEVCFYSESWSSSTYAALSPDNWLITPEVAMGGTLKFKTWNYSSTYIDQIAVYYAPADWETTDDFIQISDVLTPGTTAEEIEIDLSDYEGMGVIAFRHFGVSDMMRIFVSNVQVIMPNAPEVPDWTVVENVENPYTLEGLMPETDYEVQVMAYNADGDKMTDWTESTIFTTLAEQQVEEGYFLVGGFNDWNQTAEGGRLEFVNNKIENVEFGVAEEFKVITFDEDGTVWFGGVDDNNVGYFLLNNDLMGVEITTVRGGANFLVEEAGTYNLELIINRDGEPVLVVTKANPDAISTVGVDTKADNNWYNLQGQKLNGKPAAAGIYINGGKKVIIK